MQNPPRATSQHLLPYAESFWLPGHAAEEAALANGTGAETFALRGDWTAIVNETLAEATLPPSDAQPSEGYVHQGHVGAHSEHLGFLLAEMQSLARAHPQGVW